MNQALCNRDSRFEGIGSEVIKKLAAKSCQLLTTSSARLSLIGLLASIAQLRFAKAMENYKLSGQ